MRTWSEFYMVVATAAATLLGLLFVSVSLNAAAILGPSHEHSRRLAEQAFRSYITVLLVSLLALFPSMSLTEFGFTTLGVTAISAVWVVVRFYLALTRPADRESRFYAVRRHLISLVGFGLLIAAALGIALGGADDRNLLASAIIVLLFSATTVSWELLFRIAQVKSPDSSA